jgi:hypothetical protein
MEGTNAADFTVTSDGCTGATLDPAGSCSILVRFTPGATGVRSATLRLSHSAGADVLVPLGGSGATGTPKVALSRSTINFGSTWVGNVTPFTTVGVTNSGDGGLSIGSVGLTGEDPGDFVMGANGCSGATLSVGASCTISVAFEASEAGTHTASLTIPSNAPGSPHSVALMGTAAEDVTPPQPAFTTANNAVIVQGVHRITGTVGDDLSGVVSVTVSFGPAGAPVVRQPALSCNSARTSCTWSVTPPNQRGSTSVSVTATDRVGLSGSADPITVIIV